MGNAGAGILQGVGIPAGMDRNFALSQRGGVADEVIDAVSRLNTATASAVRAGWLVSLSITDQPPSFAGEGAVLPVVGANLQKQV